MSLTVHLCYCRACLPYKNKLICQIYNSTDHILSLNPATLTLKTFKFPWYVMLAFIKCNFHCSYRPVLGEHCVPPDAL